MTFWDFITAHRTKILGTFASVIGALQVLLATGAFNNLLDQRTLGWLGIFVGLLLAAVGFNNSTQERVASVIETAIKSTPPETK
jgi:hypothetical protein